MHRRHLVLWTALVCACNAPDHDGKTDDTDGDILDPSDTDVVSEDTDDTVVEDTDCASQTWYTDADLDGYGADVSAQTGCEPPVGSVGVGGDCDDADGDLNPGAVEVCDGVDNNCDGVIDNADLDGDGWVSCPSSGGQLDVVVIIDDSSSMSDEQVSMGAQSGAFFDQLTDGAYDWRIAVITTSQGTQFGATIVPTLADPRAAFASAVARGAVGSDDERHFQQLDTFLSTSGWRRNGASLAVWALSDEDDFSATTLENVVDLMRAGGPDTSAVFSVISGGWEGCDVNGHKATPSPRLVELSARTGGAFASICDADWFTTWSDHWIPTEHVDCDDADADVFPGAGERCNGVDDNCDGNADEDADDDGLAACADCDDANPHRGGSEVCDGVDNNCDGMTPANEVDADGDGVRACDDCDDTNAAIHPGAVEDCATAVDEDCDGHAEHDSVTDGDDDGDGYAICGGDCDDGDDAVLPFAPEQRFNGVDDDCDAALDGRDRDVVFPLPTTVSTGRVTFDGGAPWFRVCGVDYDVLTVGTDGWLSPGGSSINDWTPTVAEMESYAPFVAAGWSNLTLNGWTPGRFLAGYPVAASLILVQRADTVSVVWDNVPVVGGGTATTIATLGHDAVEVAVLHSDAPDDTMVGWACASGDWAAANGSTDPVCLDTAGHDAGSFTFADVAALPVVAKTCVP